MAAPAQLRTPVRRLPPRVPPPPLPRFPRLLLAVVLGVVAAVAVLAARSTGVLEGGVALLVAVLLVLLVPTSRDLCRRILLAGCLLLGWVPLLWWVPLPVGAAGRVTIGLALLAGALGAWVGWAERPLRRAARLLPRPRAVDLLVPVTVGAGLVELQNWLQVKTARQTLGMLMSGWDNSAHFSMVHMIRRNGVTTDVLAAPPGGGTWQFDSYPQGFHAVIATLIEVLVGPAQGDLGAELLAYSQAVALLVIALTTMLVAGFCALPALRRRPAVAVPVAAFAAAVLYVGPGATSIQGGIGNFTMACALVVAAALIAVPQPRVFAPLPLAALGGAVVGIASSWVLLLVLAAPVVAALLVPLGRRRWSASWLRVVLSVLLVLAVLGCLWRTLVVISRVRAASPLTLTGGVPPVNLGLAAAAAIGVAGTCLLVRRGATGSARPTWMRVTALVLVPVVAVGVSVGLVLVQIDANGKATYYGLKFMLGAEIVLLLLLAIPLAHLLGRRPAGPRSVLGSVRGFAGSVLVALAATQVFGFTAIDLAGVGLGPEAPGSVDLAQQVTVLRRPPSTADLADRVMRAEAAGGLPAHSFFVDARPDRPINSILAAQWYLSLTGSWTFEANVVAAGVRFADSPLGAAEQVRWVLATSPDTVALVPFESRYGVLKALNRPDLAYRVVGI